MNLEFDTSLFSNYWHMACHRIELENFGDYIKYETPLGDVVLFNDSGNIIAFDNLCPHRKAKIFESDFGNGAISCRYHGWTFSGDQATIPDSESFSGCNLETVRLNKYSVEWCGDFIFFAVSPQSELYDQLDGVAEVLENISFNITQRVDFNRYKFNCYWPIAIENALEPYHIDFVHRGTLAKLGLEDGENKFYGLNSIWYAPISELDTKKKLAGFGKFFNIDFQYEGYMSVYMFPFSMISSTFGYSYSHQTFFPAKNSNIRTNFTSKLLSTNLNPKYPASLMSSFFNSTASVNRRVFEEDHAVCMLIDPESWSFKPLEYKSNKEIKLAHFRSLCEKFFLGGS